MKNVAVRNLLVVVLPLAGALQAQESEPQGDEFQVNSYATGSLSYPAVVSDVQGNFAVSWHSEGSYGTDTSSRSIQGQRVAADRSFLGDEFQVNSYTTSSQFGPAIAAGPGGSLVAAWHSTGSAGTDTDGSIQARRFETGMFIDGFESGDTSAWSSTVQ